MIDINKIKIKKSLILSLPVISRLIFMQYRLCVQNKQLTYYTTESLNLQTNILIDKLLKKNKDKGN